MEHKKQQWRWILGLWAMVLGGCLFLAACDIGNSDNDDDSSGRITFTAKTVYSEVLTTAPVLTNTATGFVSRGPDAKTLDAGAWANGDLKSIYAWIKDFNPDLSTMVQDLDDSNFYCALSSTISSLQVGLASANDATFSAPKLIPTPLSWFTKGFDVLWTGGGHRTVNDGTTTGDYYWVANGDSDANAGDLEGIAIRLTSEGGGQARCIAYLKKAVDGTVDLDQISYGGTDSESGGSRVVLAGNTETRQFSVRGGYINAKTSTSYYCHNVFSARGSAATGGYFILYYEGTNGAWDGATHTDDTFRARMWLKVPAGADDATLNGLTCYGSYEDLRSAVGDDGNFGGTVGGATLTTDLPVLGISEFIWTPTELSAPTGIID